MTLFNAEMKEFTRDLLFILTALLVSCSTDKNSNSKNQTELINPVVANSSDRDLEDIILDAQRLAEANNLDPEVWNDHVEEMLLELRFPKHYNKNFIKYGYVRGSEPVAYVDQILERYDHYRQFIAADKSD